MKRPNLVEDIRPVSEFRAHAAALIEHVRTTKRAVILTQHGRSSAVVVDVGEYEQLLAEIELLRDIHTAEGQLAAGAGISHSEARAKILAALEG